MIVSLYTASSMAPAFKEIADRIGYNAGVGESLWNSSLNGNSYLTVWVAGIVSGNFYALISIPLLALLIFLAWRYYTGVRSGTIELEKRKTYRKRQNIKE